jgi:hypothetical protein
MVHINSFFSRNSVRPATGLLFLAGSLAAHLASAQVAFQQGTLAVVRHGDRTATAVPNGTLPAYVDEYTTTGTLVRSIDLPVADAGSNFGYLGSSVRSNADGVVGISPDRSRLSVAGFNLAAGNGNPNGSSAARVMAIVTANGAVSTSVALIGSANPLRCSMVSNSGGLYYAFGAESTGLVYAPATAATTPPVATPLASATVVLPTVSFKKMHIYDGNLYFSTTSNGTLTAGAKIRRFTGVPTTAATATDLPGIPATSVSPAASGFVMFDVNPAIPGVDLLYYADDAAATVINKYSYNGTTWVARGSFTVAPNMGDGLLRDLTGRLENGQPVLYGVSYTSLYKFADASTYTTAANITQTILVDNAQGGVFAFRGVSFSPGTREQITLGTASAKLAREIALWPNPAANEVQLSLPASLERETMQVSVLNTLGQKVAARSLAAGAVRVLPLAGLAAGVYTVQLHTSAGTVTKRLVRE